MSTSTDWLSRPVPSAMSPEQLAAFVDNAVSRTDGMLFTATPAEELDAIGRFQQIWEPIGRAEQAGTDDAKLAAYNELRSLLSWLKYPLDDDTVYEI